MALQREMSIYLKVDDSNGDSNMTMVCEDRVVLFVMLSDSILTTISMLYTRTMNCNIKTDIIY